MRLSLFLLLLISSFSFSQTIDVQHYRFELQLSDESDKINGKAIVVVKYLQPVKEFSLDLVQPKNNGKGMRVEAVKGKSFAAFLQSNDLLKIELANTSVPAAVDSFEISYSGVPADGLIISRNKFGDRTFFADNWPTRAHHWIPCNDDPGDKASVEFLVTAPCYYQVISNGIRVEESNIDKSKKLTHWKEDIPIPTKIMVIGAAQFSVARVDDHYPIPVTAWVYPQNREKGIYDYSVAVRILQFLTQYIGPFPFQKLANVQSTTIFGGMENASAIFYDEKTVTGKRTVERTVAHEIAHQWFGDMATEKNFAHLWLSEGFANYLTDIYTEHQYGKERANEYLVQERDKVISFSRINNQPVVDSLSDFMDLLNANSYEKGGWILHMLRREVGDDVFQKIVQQYYQQYKGSNADTRDFERVAEKVSGKELKWFFDQWLYQAGIPRIKVQWKMQGDELVINIHQTGKTLFQFPLTVGYSIGNKMMDKTVRVTKQNESFTIPVSAKPSKLVLDPYVNLLFEGSVSEGR